MDVIRNVWKLIARKDETSPVIHNVLLPTDIPENILAFRKITSMLSQLPRSTPIEVIDNLDDVSINKLDRQILKMSDAFAHVTVGEHDIAALTANRTVGGNTGLSLLVSTTTQGPSPLNLPSSKEGKCSILSFSWAWNLIWRNQETFPPIPRHPTIDVPLKPEDLGERSAYEYMVYLEENWKQLDLHNHLWILSNALTDKAPDLYQRLSKYMVAFSHRTIARRFNNEYLSTPYVDALKQVTDVPSMSKDQKQPQDTAQPKSRQHERDILREIQSDRQLLSVLRLLPPGRVPIQIPNLLKAAENSQDKDFLLYTNETRMEFHLLLLDLLDRFKEALATLVAMDKPEKFDRQSFSKSVDLVHLCGFMLLRLSRGRAFKMHLENIQTVLQEPIRPSVETSTQAREGEGGATLEKESLLNPNKVAAEEFDGVVPNPGPGKALLKSYVAWLRLMVGHFDAVEVLCLFVSSEKFRLLYNSIDLKILVAPPTDRTQLKWGNFIQNPKYFPSAAGSSPSPFNNQEIYDFLKRGIKAAHKLNAAGGKRSLFAKAKPGSTSIANAGHKAPDQQIEALARILGQRHDVMNFFTNLENEAFAGTLHSEAFIASLLPAFVQKRPHDDINYKEIKILPQMQGFGPVIGVSKRCCPTCAYFLEALTPPGGEQFLVRGNHGVISPCTLPLWTPSTIVDLMNAFFGQKLRQDLVTFMDEIEGKGRGVERRCKSTGSETLSLDSIDGLGEDFFDSSDYFSAKFTGHV